MRSGVTVIVTFLCCIVGLVTVLTIGSFTLQENEIERAMDFTVKQVARHCMDEGVEDVFEIETLLANTFSSQINSKNGNLTFFVLYADANLIDVDAEFSYKQFNGTKKTISCRKTYIRDWEKDKEEEAELRFISEKYAYEPTEDGGLKADSIWRYDTTLENVFKNKKLANGTWENSKATFEIKIEE